MLRKRESLAFRRSFCTLVRYNNTSIFSTNVFQIISKKVVIEGSNSGVEYANIPIRPGHAVRPDILFDLKREHVYAMTDKKLSKVRVQDCSIYTSCGECLGSKDPYCGWCSLENKCSLRGDCRDAAQDPLYWI